MNRLHLISVFVAVADNGSFAGAARKLGISPPAVTRAIRELEEDLGVSLVTRNTRIVRVTEDGANYASSCRRIIAELADADDALRNRQQLPHGQLTITAPSLFGPRFLTPVITEYLCRYPAVNVSCWYLDRVMNLLDEGVDAAVRLGELPESSLRYVRVGRLRRVVCASPSYLEARGVPQTPQALSGHSIVSTNAAITPFEWHFVQDGKSIAVKLHPRMVTNSDASALSAVVSGFGVTCLLNYLVADELRNGTLVELLADFEAAAIPVSLVHHEGRQESPKVRTFLDMARDRLRSHAELNPPPACRTLPTRHS